MALLAMWPSPNQEFQFGFTWDRTPLELIAPKKERSSKSECESDLSGVCVFVSQLFPQALLSKMPKGGTLINTARVEVVHEADMLEVLSTRSDFCYLCDVAPKDIEPFKARGCVVVLTDHATC